MQEALFSFPSLRFHFGSFCSYVPACTRVSAWAHARVFGVVLLAIAIAAVDRRRRSWRTHGRRGAEAMSVYTAYNPHPTGKPEDGPGRPPADRHSLGKPGDDRRPLISVRIHLIGNPAIVPGRPATTICILSGYPGMGPGMGLGMGPGMDLGRLLPTIRIHLGNPGIIPGYPLMTIRIHLGIGG